MATIVYHDGERMPAWSQRLGKRIKLRGRNVVITAYKRAVDIDFRVLGTFQQEFDGLFRPFLWDVYFATIPRFPLVGIATAQVGRLVETVQGRSLSVRIGGAGQGHHIREWRCCRHQSVRVEGKVPLASQTDGRIVSRSIQAQQTTNQHYCGSKFYSRAELDYP